MSDTVVINGDINLINAIEGDMNLDSTVSGDPNVQFVATDITPATTDRLGGIIVGDDLEITPTGVLSVIKSNRAEQDNTHPITSAAVYTEIGNIDVLLQTI